MVAYLLEITRRAAGPREAPRGRMAPALPG